MEAKAAGSTAGRGSSRTTGLMKTWAPGAVAVRCVAEAVREAVGMVDRLPPIAPWVIRATPAAAP